MKEEWAWEVIHSSVILFESDQVERKTESGALHSDVCSAQHANQKQTRSKTDRQKMQETTKGQKMV